MLLMSTTLRRLFTGAPSNHDASEETAQDAEFGRPGMFRRIRYKPGGLGTLDDDDVISLLRAAVHNASIKAYALKCLDALPEQSRHEILVQCRHEALGKESSAMATLIENRYGLEKVRPNAKQTRLPSTSPFPFPE
jgi:hypothetical protein